MKLDRLAFTVGVLLIAGVARAEGQTCTASQAVVNRLYVALSEPDALSSEQLAIGIGDSGPVALTYERAKRRWFVDLAPPFLQPVLLSNLAPSGITTVTIMKTGWTFTRRAHDVVGEVEREGGQSRCTTLLGFHLDPAWRLRVVAEPEGNARRVKMYCGTCPRDAETDFTTNWTREQILTLEARFLQATDSAGQLSCAARLEVREYHTTTRFSYGDLLRLLPQTCRDPFVLARIQHLVPDSISVRPSRQ